MTCFRHAARLASAVAAMVGLGIPTCIAETTEPASLRLEATIPLGTVAGRIDHLAIDLSRHRLFVAQLGANSVSVVDLDAQKVMHVIEGLKEPQGVAYVGLRDMLYVANGGDGLVRLFQGKDFKEIHRIEFGDDADNIRVDKTGTRVFVGYGAGKVAEIDSVSHAKTADVQLEAHPESFQLDRSGARSFTNVPGANEIAVVDYPAGRQVASWPMNDRGTSGQEARTPNQATNKTAIR